ncbi:MAG: TonB family protein [Acidobacteriota bacterium]|nr:TonB family protein [Acidobacteriota bacterium]
MRGRVTKAKAFIAVKNYNAAIYELEGIRREINDPTVHSVVNVMLMNCYLEQGDYKRAQAFLNELYKAQTANKPNAAQHYFSVAAQVVKGARSQQERYKSLGLTMNDRNLTPDAVADVEKMRETVEMVIAQSKTMSADKKKASDAFALVEESSNARIALARDDYDAKRWKEEVADAREGLMTSRSTVLNAAGDEIESPNNSTNTTGTVASNQPNYTNSTPTTTTSAPLKTETQPNLIPTSNQVAQRTGNTTEQAQNNNVRLEPVPEQKQSVTAPETTKPSETVAERQPTPNVNPNAADNAPKVPTRERRVNTPNTNTETTAQNTNATTPKADGDNSPLQVGSLVEYATQKVNPIYPPQAKTLRMTGVVKVEVTIDEQGQVAAVQNSSGPSLLQRAAADALRKWRFKPFTRDGQPVKAKGFVNFNFNL